MLISVINHTTLDDAVVLETIRAVNRQIAEDFQPYWSISARLRLEGKSDRKPTADSLSDLRGDAILYLWDEVDVDDALGYHDANNRGIPYGFVFRKLSEQLGEKWTVTFSHEALELIGDAESNLLVAGPHPKRRSKEVFHWFEMCDAVQDESYEIDGIAVSNFVLPPYFTIGDELGSRNDFLSVSKGRKSALKSFGVNPGGYVGFYDPETGEHDTFSSDKRADERQRIKSQARNARRAMRYQGSHTGEAVTSAALTRSVTFEGFAVASTAADAKHAVSQAVKNVLRVGWNVESLGPDSYRVTHPRTVLSTAEAWQAAHALRKEADIQRAEPLFELEFVHQDDLEVHGLATPATRRGRSIFGSDHKRGTEAKDWSIAMIRVREAWKQSRGKGILVAHPDTGYTKHPEIFGEAAPRILPNLGHDYVDGNADPTDDLDSGFLRFPGHGTETASVIMSSDQAPLGEAANQVFGVAPECNLVPLRVSRSVVHLSMDNLIQAIHKAIDINTHVISMSLGGLFSDELHDAIKRAVANDIIVLAAAGNFVGFVTWPAAYDEVIAVAACNVDQGEWSGSSRGEAVDISAPGESVWVALPERNSKFSVVRSSGTSFAVAHVAGVAALWLAKHGRANLIAKYGKGNVAAVFKDILIRSGHDLPNGWDTDSFGAGIVNAEKVLAAALPAAQPAHGMRRLIMDGSARSSSQGLQRFFHLLPNVQRRDVETVLSHVIGEDLGDSATDELAFHLATNTAVRDAFLQPIRKGVSKLARRAAVAATPGDGEGRQDISVDSLRKTLGIAGGSPRLIEHIEQASGLRAPGARPAARGAGSSR